MRCFLKWIFSSLHQLFEFMSRPTNVFSIHGIHVTFTWNACLLKHPAVQKIASCILGVLEHRCIEHYRNSFVANYPPILEHRTSVWSPDLVPDVGVAKECLENFPQNYRSPFQSNYMDSLKIFNLEPLEYRRFDLDPILWYKIVFSIAPPKMLYFIPFPSPPPPWPTCASISALQNV